MSNELIDISIRELENTKKLCMMLMESPHYKKIGSEGIYAIVEMAKAVGVDPLQALNGGMYYVKGKVEMSAMLMNSVIRQQKHSITKDPKSDETICILHGKRADNGDEWTESFSIEDATAAKLLSNPTWTAYRKDMLFARALSRLARQLYPDILKGCYIQGEIAMDTAINPSEPVLVVPEFIGEESALLLAEELNKCPDYAAQVNAYLERNKIQLKDLPIESADKIYLKLRKLLEVNNE